ncbi:MAG: hypothetical protein ABI613_02100 [Gemmatimonadota bacterium]
MKIHGDLTGKHRATLYALLSLAIAAPVLFQAMPFRILPNWVGAAIGMAALFGGLVLFWRAGAMHLRYLVLLVAAIVVAVISGSLA